jgi:16S rRNA processing protein RimM
LLEVGRIAKAHGIKGEVLVDLLTDRVERVAVGSVLSTKLGQELAVTFSSSHLGKWIVRFEGVGTRTEAEALHGLALFAEPIEDPDALFVHDLIGSTVVADGVVIGTVASVEANPASDLLVLDNAKLIPVRFVVERSPDGRLVVDLPEGLLDL